MIRHRGAFAFPFLMVAAALPVAPSALRAQEVRDTASLPEIVVTATRYPIAPDSVASTVTVLRGDDLRAEGIRFVGDALRQVPGAHVVQGGPYGAATSLFVRGGESDYVKVLVDGVPVNQPGGFYDFASLTTDNVERIEVLRVTGSVLYGSDAIAGVIQIVTRQGDHGVRVGPRRAKGAASAARAGKRRRWAGVSASDGRPRSRASPATAPTTSTTTTATRWRAAGSACVPASVPR